MSLCFKMRRYKHADVGVPSAGSGICSAAPWRADPEVLAETRGQACSTSCPNDHATDKGGSQRFEICLYLMALSLIAFGHWGVRWGYVGKASIHRVLKPSEAHCVTIFCGLVGL